MHPSTPDTDPMEKQQMTTVSIAGLSKAKVLAALYNRSKQQGMGFCHARGSLPMTEDQASAELERSTNFDYLHGRVMKISLDGDELYTGLYNRDVGQGAAEQVIAQLRAESKAA